jgi:hypothetical protein
MEEKLLAKWEAEGEIKVVTWLRDHWTGELFGNWKLGTLGKGLPLHNNGLEGFNG